MKKTIAILTVAFALISLGFIAQPAMAQGSITGTIADADGNAVAGAMVVVQGQMNRRGQRPFMARAESGEDGSFGFDAVPQGRYVVSTMVRELGGARAEANVLDGQATEVALVLQGRGGRGGDNGGGRGGNGGGEERPAGSLTGTVLDVDGNAVEGARVVLMAQRLEMRRGQARVHRLLAETDANGQFSIESVPAGVWVVTAGKREVGAGRERVTIVAGEASDVTITLNHNR